MGWQEQRRLAEAARAEQARQDRLAAAQVEQVRARTRVETAQAVEAQRAELDRQRLVDREARKNEARDRRRARWTALLGWCAAHTVDLMIYPLALVSAVMAVPAMAEFGHDVYGTAAGYALPVITELGMWAFAFAVHLVRGGGVDRPVWALQVGVWSFATVAAGLNFLHGLTGRPDLADLVSPVAAGVVMAVASVAGVVAHQLVTAAPRRGRTERDADRIERQATAKVTRVRRAAVRTAVAEIDQDGAARLLFTPGHYHLTRSWVAPWRRGWLDSTALTDQPDATAPVEEWDEFDRELAVLLATVDPYPGSDTGNDTGTRPTVTGGGVGTLDPDPNQRESTPIDPTDTGTDRSPTRSRSTRKTARKVTRKSGRRSARSIDALRAELNAAIEADPTSIDPTSAESIRRALRCSPARARQLRDTYRPNH